MQYTLNLLHCSWKSSNSGTGKTSCNFLRKLLRAFESKGVCFTSVCIVHTTLSQIKLKVSETSKIKISYMYM